MDIMAKFLNPTNDLAFKRIFGTEKNKDILLHFLNDIFSRGDNLIEEVTFLNTFHEREVASNRVSIVGILCRGHDGSRFIVEMQVASEPGFEKRAQYYAAKAYIQQREKGMDYKDLKAVTFIAITGYTLFPERKDYLSHHHILDTDTHDHALQDFSFSFLELPKFNKAKDELSTMIDKWAYFFKHAEETLVRDLDIIAGKDVIIKRAYEELDQLSWNEGDLWNYEGYMR